MSLTGFREKASQSHPLLDVTLSAVTGGGKGAREARDDSPWSTLARSKEATGGKRRPRRCRIQHKEKAGKAA